MTVDHIRELTLGRFPELEARARNNPRGWAFWFSVDYGSRPSIRIFRVLERSAGPEIKWALSESTEIWNGSDDALIGRIEEEIATSGRLGNKDNQKLAGLTREHILKSLDELDGGGEHGFGESTGYDLLYRGKRYPPKAVVGVASRFLSGDQLGPYDFKGGLNSKCFRVLEGNGFQIVTKGDSSPFPDELQKNEVHTEGAVAQVLVNRYERDPKARKKCIALFGAVCQVCNMDFKSKYGTVGEGFIHVHHVKLISEIGGEYIVDPSSDLVPVCPNCHAMLHKRTPPFTIEELQELMG